MSGPLTVGATAYLSASEILETALETLPPHDLQQPTIVVDGNNATIKMQHGHLLIEDGPRCPKGRRTIQLARAFAQSKRILILAWHGIITLDAIQWCRALEIELVALDPSRQEILLHSGHRRDVPQLRRAQALAASDTIGLQIMRYLIGAKFHGQNDNLQQLQADHTISDPASTNMMDMALHLPKALEDIRTVEECRGIEAQMAVGYWQQLSRLPVKWDVEARRIPEHWKTVGPRHSPKSHRTTRQQFKPRNAVSPAHAIINYCYRLAETETIIALHAIGLDPGIGILHADRPNRQNMALDCLEAIRPHIDRYVLTLLARHPLTTSDVCELETGICHLLPPFTHELAQTMPAWRKAVAPVVEHVAWMLQHPDRQGNKQKRTPLSRANAKPATPETTPTAGRHQARHHEWQATMQDDVQQVPTADLAKATGLNRSYIRRIKAGQLTPAREHWPAFEKAIIERNGSL